MDTYIIEWCVVRCGSKNKHPNNYVFKRDWSMYSKYANHSRLDSWVGGVGGTYMTT